MSRCRANVCLIVGMESTPPFGRNLAVENRGGFGRRTACPGCLRGRIWVGLDPRRDRVWRRKAGSLVKVRPWQSHL